jgi:hypothetical protein
MAEQDKREADERRIRQLQEEMRGYPHVEMEEQTLHAEREGVLDWPKIVNTVVAFFITAMCCGVVTLLSWVATELIANGKALTRIEVKQDADRQAQDKLVEIYAKDIVELRQDIELQRSYIEDLERELRPPAAADDDDDDAPPMLKSKAVPAPRLKKDYADVVKGHISRARENQMQQHTAPPNMEIER